MKLALAIYFASFAFGLFWLCWIAVVATNLVDPSSKVQAWPLLVAVVANVGAKFAMRSLDAKGEPHG